MVDQTWTLGQGFAKHAKQDAPKEANALSAPTSATVPIFLILIGAFYLLSLMVIGMVQFSRSDDAVRRVSSAEKLQNIAAKLSSTTRAISDAEGRYFAGGNTDALDEMHLTIRAALDLIDTGLLLQPDIEKQKILSGIRSSIERRHDAIDQAISNKAALPQPSNDLPKLDVLQAQFKSLEWLAGEDMNQAHRDYVAASELLRLVVLLALLGVFVCSVTQIIIHRRRIQQIADSRNALAAANLGLKAAFKESDQKRVYVEKMFNASLSASKMTMFIQNRDLVISWIHNPQFGSATDLIGKRDTDFMPVEAAQQTVKVKKQVIETGIGQQLEYSYSKAGKIIHKWLQVDPILDNGTVIGLIGVAIDVTERRLRETQIEALASELVHRNQNMLAVISSMSRRLFRTSESMAEFETRFDSRLQAISRSFDVIVREEWEGAQLDVLIKAQLESVAPGLSDRVTMTGQALLGSPHFVETIGSAIHELAQNALNHGALSKAAGRVSIDWWLQTDLFNTQRISFVWRENDGSDDVPVIPYRGYGMNILEKIVPQAVNGQVNVALKPGGFSWYLSCPWLTPNEGFAQRLSEPMTEETDIPDMSMHARDTNMPAPAYSIESGH